MMKENYKIDPAKYYILRKWCLGYWRKKHKIQTILESGGLKFAPSSKIEGMYSNPTEDKAIKIMELEADCEVIEKIVKNICADYDVLASAKKLLDLSEFILLNVTTSNKWNSWRSLKARGYNIPVGRNKFYLLRDKFFHELNEYFQD